ncbi:MAG: hypothetical protein ACFFD1_10225 [Candidatus Thorarchaeota archaeon]
MVIPSENFDKSLEKNHYFLNIISEVLPSIRYFAYILLPYIFYFNFPLMFTQTHLSNLNEKIMVYGTLGCLMVNAFYILLRNRIYDKGLLLGGTVVGLTFGSILIVDTYNMSLDQISLIYGFSVAVFISLILTYFDKFRYGQLNEKQGKRIIFPIKEIDSENGEQNKFRIRIEKKGFFIIQLIGFVQITILQYHFEQLNSLNGLLTELNCCTTEYPNRVEIIYYPKAKGWFFQRKKLEKKLKEKIKFYKKNIEQYVTIY